MRHALVDAKQRVINNLQILGKFVFAKIISCVLQMTRGRGLNVASPSNTLVAAVTFTFSWGE